jgi:hypothetical protein
MLSAPARAQTHNVPPSFGSPLLPRQPPAPRSVLAHAAGRRCRTCCSVTLGTPCAPFTSASTVPGRRDAEPGSPRPPRGFAFLNAETGGAAHAAGATALAPPQASDRRRTACRSNGGQDVPGPGLPDPEQHEPNPAGYATAGLPSVPSCSITSSAWARGFVRYDDDHPAAPSAPRASKPIGPRQLWSSASRASSLAARAAHQ